MWRPDAEDETWDEATAEVDRIVKAVRPAIEALHGHVFVSLDATDNTHEISFLLPFSIAEQATSIEDYFAGLDYLINGSCDPLVETIEATFVLQAWVNDYAVAADVDGPDEFDVTFDVLLKGKAPA